MTDRIRKYKMRRLRRRLDRLQRNDADYPVIPEDRVTWVSLGPEGNKHPVPVDRETGKVGGPVGEKYGGELHVNPKKSKPIRDLRKSEEPSEKSSFASPPSEESVQSESSGQIDVGGARDVKECTDVESLRQTMKDRNIIFKDSILDEYDFESIRDALSMTASVFDAFPVLKKKGAYISIDKTRSKKEYGQCVKTYGFSTGAIMGRPEIQFSRLYTDKSDLQKRYSDQVKKNGFVSGSTPDSVGAHEAAHILCGMLMKGYVEKMRSKGKDVSINDLVNTQKYCVSIITGAYRDVKNGNLPEDADDRNQELGNMLYGVSIYALESAEESIAESFSDVFTNGSKAQPISLAIYKRMYQRLGGEDIEY